MDTIAILWLAIWLARQARVGVVVPATAAVGETMP